MRDLVVDFTVAMKVMSLIESGRYTKTRACEAYGITTSQYDATVNKTPEMARMAEEAQQRGYDSLAEHLIDPGSGVIGTDPKMAAVLSKNIMFLLSRAYREKYGDHVQVDVNVSADALVVSALQAARERAVAHAVGQVIDIEYTPVPALPPPPVQPAALPASVLAELEKLY
jgi:hypothetical protein